MWVAVTRHSRVESSRVVGDIFLYGSGGNWYYVYTRIRSSWIQRDFQRQMRGREGGGYVRFLFLLSFFLSPFELWKCLCARCARLTDADRVTCWSSTSSSNSSSSSTWNSLILWAHSLSLFVSFLLLSILHSLFVVVDLSISFMSHNSSNIENENRLCLFSSLHGQWPFVSRIKGLN